MPQRPSRVSPINLRGSSVLMHDPSPGPRKWAENGYRRSLFPSCGMFAGEVETDPDWSWGYRRWMEGQTLQELDRICFIQREAWSGLTLMLEGLLSVHLRRPLQTASACTHTNTGVRVSLVCPRHSVLPTLQGCLQSPWQQHVLCASDFFHPHCPN